MSAHLYHDSHGRELLATGVPMMVLEDLFRFARYVAECDWVRDRQQVGKCMCFTPHKTRLYRVIKGEPLAPGVGLLCMHAIMGRASTFREMWGLYLARIEVTRDEVSCLFYMDEGFHPHLEENWIAGMEAIELVVSSDGTCRYRILYGYFRREQTSKFYERLIVSSAPSWLPSVLEDAHIIVAQLHRQRPKRESLPQGYVNFPLDQHRLTLWAWLTDCAMAREIGNLPQVHVLDMLKVIKDHQGGKLISIQYGPVPGELVDSSWVKGTYLHASPLNTTYGTFSFTKDEGTYRIRVGCYEARAGWLMFLYWLESSEFKH